METSTIFFTIVGLIAFLSLLVLAYLSHKNELENSNQSRNLLINSSFKSRKYISNNQCEKCRCTIGFNKFIASKENKSSEK